MLRHSKKTLQTPIVKMPTNADAEQIIKCVWPRGTEEGRRDVFELTPLTHSRRGHAPPEKKTRSGIDCVITNMMVRRAMEHLARQRENQKHERDERMEQRKRRVDGMRAMEAESGVVRKKRK